MILTYTYSFSITVFPFVFIAVFYIAIAIKLCIHKHSNNTSHVPTSAISTMSLAIVITFVLLYFPIVLCYIIARAMSEELLSTDYIPLFIAGQVSNLLLKVNGATNFIFYMLLCKTFSSEAKKKLCCCRFKDSVSPHNLYGCYMVI